MDWIIPRRVERTTAGMPAGNVYNAAMGDGDNVLAGVGFSSFCQKIGHALRELAQRLAAIDRCVDLPGPKDIEHLWHFVLGFLVKQPFQHTEVALS